MANSRLRPTKNIVVLPYMCKCLFGFTFIKQNLYLDNLFSFSIFLKSYYTCEFNYANFV